MATNNSPKKSSTTTTATMETARVVVVGAGPAGIAAATRLLESGFRNVLLLEAEDRVGGRVHTVPFGDNVVDLGAQWCHGERDNVVYERVRDLGLLESTGSVYDDYKCIRSNGELVPDALSAALKAIAASTIPSRQTDLRCYEGSLGAYLTERFWAEVDRRPEPLDRVVAGEFLANYKKFESSIEASDHLFEVSGRGHLEYWLCEGDLLLNWKDKGFRTFLRQLMRSRDGDGDDDDLGLLNQRVLLNRPVERILWQSEKDEGTRQRQREGEREREVLIRCRNGEIVAADHVICTVSLGVLQASHAHLFEPALPAAKRRAIDGLRLGTVDKFFLEFAAPVGPPDWTGFCLLWRDEDLAELRASPERFWLESVFGFFRVSHQPRLLQGWIVGPHARHMETLAAAEVERALLWLLGRFLAFPVPQPERLLRTQWHSNPHFRGSYSFRSLYTDELRTGAWDLAAPLADSSGRPRLLFAGEATSSHHYSTVHGAVESGWREAQRLVAFYEGRPQAKL